MTQTEPPRADDGWIEWKAGKCPVPFDTMVDCRFRDGKEIGPARAGGWAVGICGWKHEGKFRQFDIIAYRLAPTDG